MGIVIFIGIIIVVYFIAFANREDKTIYHSIEDYRLGPRTPPVKTKPIDEPIKAIPKIKDSSIDNLNILIRNIKRLDHRFSITSKEYSSVIVGNDSGSNEFFLYATDYKNSVSWTFKDGDDITKLTWHELSKLPKKEYFTKIKKDLEPHKAKFSTFNQEYL